MMIDRALVLADDRWHPASTPRTGLAALGEEIQLDWIEHASEWSAECMAQYPLVIFTKSNNISYSEHEPWMDDAAQAAFVEYVRKGGNLLAIHSGTASYHDVPVIRNLLGGVFIKHPPQCEVTLQPAEGKDLLADVSPFTVTDEFYMMAVDDPNIEIVLTAKSEHGSQPAAWLRHEGAGRVAVLTPGHNPEVWLAPEFQQIMRKLLAWCIER